MVNIARSFRLRLLTITVMMGCLSCGVCLPTPSISSISPNSATAGGNQLLLTVNGSDFRRASVVNWNGSFRLTTFVSPHQLVAGILTTDIARPGTVLVSVFNPPEQNTVSFSGAIGVGTLNGCRGKFSNAVSFTLNP